MVPLASAAILPALPFDLPQPFVNQPLAQCLMIHIKPIALTELLCGKRRPKVLILLAVPLDHLSFQLLVVTSV